MSSSGRAAGTTANAHYLTFSGPVMLPGVELRAGTYIFERASPETNGTVVRVLSRDRKRIYLTAFTNTVDRPARLRQQPVTLAESPRGVPPAVLVWYPVDGPIGHAFIYR